MSTKAPRKYVSDFVLQVGPINLSGALVPVLRTGAGEYKEFFSVCPKCPEGMKPKQGYTCDLGHGPYTISELDKAKDLGDGNYAKVTKAEYDEARKSPLPLNAFTAVVHDNESFTAATWNADSAYVFQPRITDQYYALLTRLITESGRVFVAMCNVKHNEALYRLDVWDGNIVMQKVFWPDDVNEFSAPEAECDDMNYNAAVGMLDRIATEFTPDNYVSNIKTQMLTMTAELTGEPAPARPATEPAQPAQTLLEALNAFG